MRKRKYEISERLERKTWEIEQQGAALTTRFWARKGTPARVVRHDLDSEDDATQRFDSLVADREEQGYALIDAEEDGSAPAVDAEALAFEAAIAAAPDVADAYLVYGDWLGTQGDPLGELVAVQAALTGKPRDGTLLARQRALLDRHAARWLGPLAGEGGFDAEWRWGFLESVDLGVDEPCTIEPVDALRALFRLPTSRFLRELTLADFEDGVDGTCDFGDAVEALAKSPLRVLRSLSIEPRRTRLDDIEVGDLSVLLARFRQLENLSLKARVVTLGKVDLPELVRFKLLTRATRAVVRSVATARWPKLTQLVFGYGKRGEGSTPRDLAPIFDGAGLPSLTHLALRGLPFADEVVTMLRSAKLLPQLRSLDLSKGELTSSGAEMLVGMASALEGLEDLDLSGNGLPRRAVAALQRTFGDRLFVDTDGDETPGGDDDGEERYDEIDE